MTQKKTIPIKVKEASIQKAVRRVAALSRKYLPEWERKGRQQGWADDVFGVALDHSYDYIPTRYMGKAYHEELASIVCETARRVRKRLKLA
jgi:hypothetical protein